MDKKKRTQCGNCSRKLNKAGLCSKCGWNYDKGFKGQQELLKKEQEKK